MSGTPAETTDRVLETGIWHIEDGQLQFRPEGFNGSVPDSHRFAFTEQGAVELAPATLAQMHAIAAQVPAYYAMLRERGDQLPPTGTSSQYSGLKLDQWSPPPITMLDAMITPDGDVMIAEVDVINPRGLGYLAMYQRVYAESADVETAIEAVRQAVVANGRELTILQGSMQNFYGPYLHLLQQALQQQGVGCTVTREQAITYGEDGRLHVGDDIWEPHTLLDFPILKKMLKKAYGPLADSIIAAYNEGLIAILYPPQPQLSSKLLLAQASEAGIFGTNLPETVLCHDETAAQSRLALGTYCVKAAVSSGMKGLWLPESSSLAGAKYPVIAQRLIANQQIFQFAYASGGDTDWRNGRFVARLSLFVTADGTLAAADMTGQPYTGSVRGVHGNPDCVLAPVKLRQ